jgi:thiamine biosynthesis lipoprotein
MTAMRATATSSAVPEPLGSFRMERRDPGLHAVSFCAMASPCEVLLATADSALARELGVAATDEARRVECKYSRYREDSVLTAINRSGGRPIRVDEETAALIDFAAECHRLSDGLFDVTSGILRRVWKFDGSDRLPAAADVTALLPHIGFHKLRWERPFITVPDDMELDFGGIGKEYAVDRALTTVSSMFNGAVLVNFGGDLCANQASAGAPWRVGIERPDTEREARMLLELSQGALATSGDTRRFLTRGGRRYGHILDPRDGWPVRDAPRSVTVAAGTCTEAGMLASLAILQGSNAERYLGEQGVRFWCLR